MPAGMADPHGELARPAGGRAAGGYEPQSISGGAGAAISPVLHFLQHTPDPALHLLLVQWGTSSRSAPHMANQSHQVSKGSNSLFYGYQQYRLYAVQSRSTSAVLA